MPNAAETIRAAASRLAAAGIDTARLDAEVLLRHILEIDRAALFVRLREPIDARVLAAFDVLIERRLRGEPVAYITGIREFMGLPFSVGSGVLVPRPETETIVEWAANWLSSNGPRTVIDVGTGSGAIVLSLAHRLNGRPDDHFIGCESSPQALAYAARNRTRFGLDDRVQLVLGDLLNWLGSPVDLVLANLPYLTPQQVEQSPEIHAEPDIALISGDDGLAAIKRLIRDLPRVLAPGGAAMFELDPSQAERAAELLSSAIVGARVHIAQDLAGLDRFVIAETR